MYILCVTMMQKLMLFILFVINLSITATCQTLNDSISLTTETLKGYDRRHRPILNQSLPLKVNVTFDIASIQDFDEVNEQIKMIGLLFMSWVDEKLVWNPANYGWLYSQMYSVQDIWYPILVLVNTADTLTDLAEKWMTIRVYSTGKAFFIPPAVFRSTCSVDVTYYPFDTQTCMLRFVPWGYGLTEIHLYSPRTDILQSHFSENGEWTLTKTTAQSVSSSSESSVKFTFELQRKPLFLIINVLLPIIFLAVINILVFVLPVESGERMSYSITVLLSIAVFFTLVGDNLPKTSKPMSLLGYYLMGILVLSTLICVVTILNLRLYHRSDDIPVPRGYVKLINIIRCYSNRKSNIRNGRTGQTDMVDPTEANLNDKHPGTDRREALSNTDDKVTWRHVSVVVDLFSMTLFFTSMATITAVFFSILANNSPI